MEKVEPGGLPSPQVPRPVGKFYGSPSVYRFAVSGASVESWAGLEVPRRSAKRLMW